MASAESEVASFLLAPILFGRPGLPSLKFQAQICVPLASLCFIWIKYVFFLYFFSFFALFGFVSYSITGNYLGKIKIWLTNGLVSLKPQGLVKFVTTKICEALYGKIEMPIPLLSILKFRMYNCFASKENIFSGMGCVDRKFKSFNQLQYDWI